MADRSVDWMDVSGWQYKQDNIDLENRGWERETEREEEGNTSHFPPMAHEIAGDVICFDDLKENTSCPYITVSSPCVGG